MTTKELLYDEALVTLSYELIPSWDQVWSQTTEDDFNTFMLSWADMKFRRKLVKRLLQHPSRKAWVFKKHPRSGEIEDLNIVVRATIDEVVDEEDALRRTKNILQVHPNDYVRYYNEVDFRVVEHDPEVCMTEVHILQSRVDKTEIIN